MLRMNDAKRRIVIGFKTTGDKPEDGDRMTELACVELMGLEQTGNNFHTFLFPGNDMEVALMQECENEFANSERLQPGNHAEQHTIAAMRKVPGFTDQEAVLMAKMGVPAYLTDKMWEAPEFRDIEQSLMNYLRAYPNTVIVTHDIGRLKKFFRSEMTAANWKEFSENFHDPKHGMMQKVHKFRPADLFPKAKGTWTKGLGFEPICEHFDVSTENRTRYSAMQDALMLADVVRHRKVEKMDNIRAFPKSKSHPDHQADSDAETEEQNNSVRMKR